MFLFQILSFRDLIKTNLLNQQIFPITNLIIGINLALNQNSFRIGTSNQHGRKVIFIFLIIDD